MSNLKLSIFLILVLSFSSLLTSCSKPKEIKEVLIHQHHAPHGGTAVVLGNELYHLEFVLDSQARTLTAYVLDSEMENFVRIEQSTLELQITSHSSQIPLVLNAIENSATGEKQGDTSEFQCTSDFFSKTIAFDAVIKLIKINNHTFSEVKFNFPYGNDRD
jgi:hypothetical protein